MIELKAEVLESWMRAARLNHEPSYHVFTYLENQRGRAKRRQWARERGGILVNFLPEVKYF